MTAFPPEVRRLLWDVDLESIDLDRHRDFVIERVMMRGTWAAMQWLRARMPAATLADFLVRRGQLVAGLPPEDVPGGARPPWSI